MSNTQGLADSMDDQFEIQPPDVNLEPADIHSLFQEDQPDLEPANAMDAMSGTQSPEVHPNADSLFGDEEGRPALGPDTDVAETVEDGQEVVASTVEEGANEDPDMPTEQEIDTQMFDVQETFPHHDETSLFIPEASPRPTVLPSIERRPPEMLPPPFLPVAAALRSPRGGNSFDKILQMSQRLRKKASAALPPRPALTPDREDYLESIVQPDAPNSGEESEEETIRREEEEFERLKRKYDELKSANGGSFTFHQSVEWMKIQSTEDSRRKKRRREQEKAKDDAYAGPFFPGDYDQQDEESDHDDGLVMNLEGSSRKRRRPELPRKEPKQLSLQEAELQSMTVALEAAGDLPQKKKKKKRGQQPQDEPGSRKTYGKSKSPKSKIAESSKSSRAKSGRKSIPKGSHKAAKQKRDLERATQQVTSLFTSDVFVDQASIDAADQPTFTSRNKQDALKELIASVPTEDQKTVGSDMRILLAATRDFDGRGAVKTDGNGMWLVKGMKTSLKGYQLLGSAYMRRRENASEEPRGGLMADQMGLGKTLMMLANIVNGRPPKSVTVRTTLIVASPGLLSQWKQEIETHTNANLSVMRYGPGNRLDCSHKFEIFKHFDIILTTYSEIMRSYPKNEPPITMQTAEQKLAWWKVEWQKKRGVLHRMVWHRIVLDEAQMIKNHSSRTSIACRALMAIHRWALSGTPILNSLTELYPYFKFLCVPHTGSFKIFKQNYCGTSNKDSTERLLVRLKSFMIRRTHADTMFGAPILKLPRADQITKYCEFNHIERNIYDIVEARFVEKLNTWSRENELDKSYGNALVMLLRLRQLTAHVLMLQFVMRDLLEREDIERIRQVINEAAAKNPTAQASRTIVAIRKQLIELAEEEKKKGKEDPAIVEPGDPDNASAEDDSGAVVKEVEETDSQEENQRIDRMSSGKNFGKEFDFKPYLNSLTTGDNWEKVKEKARCKKCDRRPKNPWLTNCSHIYCLQCYEQRFLEAAERETELWTCGCGKTVRFCHPCNPDGELEDSQDSSPRTRSKASKRKVQPGQETVHEDWLSLGGSILPSTKTIAIKAQILNWIEENKDVKVIIYTQFLAMIQILDKACDEEGWQSEQYHGRLSFKAREKAITEFADNSRVRVLLASLRCGGLGLNLTMASRVIVIDPWWNSASEQQAFCRVFRIGQKEETFMTRFCVRNTVDDRLIAMQERKKHEIAKVMEGDNKAKKMTIRDLMRLFGPIQDAEDGRPFILVDNPDPRGGFMADRDHEGYADEM